MLKNLRPIELSLLGLLCLCIVVFLFCLAFPINLVTKDLGALHTLEIVGASAGIGIYVATLALALAVALRSKRRT